MDCADLGVQAAVEGHQVGVQRSGGDVRVQSGDVPVLFVFQAGDGRRDMLVSHARSEHVRRRSLGSHLELQLRDARRSARQIRLVRLVQQQGVDLISAAVRQQRVGDLEIGLDLAVGVH